MADEIKVIITGKDGVSKVFQEVSKSADSMQKSITKDAAAAGTSLNKMSTDAKTASTNTSRSFTDMKTAASSASTSFAVAGAAIGASLALFSREIVTNQQNVNTLTRTYGEAAGQLQAFAQQIQQSTTFSSESAIESANTFGTLARNYGVSVDQIQQLIKVSTDLATTSGLSLQDVSERVQAAIRGEGESAEALGLTMNQQAIDRNNLTLTMSNQEAAQFRLNALFEQTSFAEGAAGEKAATTAGQMAQLTNKFEDVARGAISAAGPLPQIVSGITNIGASSGLAISGMASLAKGLQSASSAMGGMSTVLGTAGFVAAAAAAYYGAQALARHFDSDFPAALHAAEGATTTLDSAISRMTVTLGDAALALRFTNADSGLDKTVKDLERIAFLREQVNTIPQGGRADDATIEQYKTELSGLEATYGDVTTAAQTAQAAQDDFAEILTHASAGSALAQQRALELSEAYNAGQMSLADYAWNLNYITENYTAYDQAALQAQVSTKGYIDYVLKANDVSQSHAQAISDLTEQYGDLGTSTEKAASHFVALWFTVHEGEFASRRAASGLNEIGGAAESAAPPTGRMVELVTGLGEAASRSASDVHLLFAELDKFPELAFGDAATMTREFDHSASAAAVTIGKFDESLLGVDQRLADYTQQAFDAAKAVGLLSTNAQLFQAAGIKTPSLDVAVNLQAGQGSFDAVFGAIKTAQSLASNLGGAKSWADQLIGDRGTWSELDNLINEGRVDADKWEVTQQAQESITRDVTNAQRDLLAVQVNLAPTLAAATHQQAVYIDSLQDMNETQQLAALGFMDTAESAKAMSLAQLAAASTSDAMRESTSNMIVAAAQADPVLQAMLESMGLISVGADGTITVHMEGQDDVSTAIDGLSTSLDALTKAIYFVLFGEAGADGVIGTADDITFHVDNIPKDPTVTISAIDNASGVIGGVSQALDGINGKTASTFLNNYVTTFTTAVGSVSPGSSGGTGPIGGRLGGVMGYANGGMVTIEAAEVGGELARFANGGSAYLPTHGLYNVPVGTNILPAPATKAEMSRRGRGGDIYINTIQIIAQNGDLEGMLRSEALRLARQR